MTRTSKYLLDCLAQRVGGAWRHLLREMAEGHFPTEGSLPIARGPREVWVREFVIDVLRGDKDQIILIDAPELICQLDMDRSIAAGEQIDPRAYPTQLASLYKMVLTSYLFELRRGE